MRLIGRKMKTRIKSENTNAKPKWYEICFILLFVPIIFIAVLSPAYFFATYADEKAFLGSEDFYYTDIGLFEFVPSVISRTFPTKLFMR